MAIVLAATPGALSAIDVKSGSLIPKLSGQRSVALPLARKPLESDQRLQGLHSVGYAIIPLEVLLARNEARAIPQEIERLKPDYTKKGLEQTKLFKDGVGHWRDPEKYPSIVKLFDVLTDGLSWNLANEAYVLNYALANRYRRTELVGNELHVDRGGNYFTAVLSFNAPGVIIYDVKGDQVREIRVREGELAVLAGLARESVTPPCTGPLRESSFVATP